MEATIVKSFPPISKLIMLNLKAECFYDNLYHNMTDHQISIRLIAPPSLLDTFFFGECYHIWVLFDYGIYEYTLWAGKHNDAGTVTITNDDDNIYVTYNTNETADLGEVHVYIWDDLSQIPSKRPSPGHADYVAENINADSYTVVMPADISCGSTFYISTHAALVGNDTDGDEAGSGDNSGETAYAGGADAPDCFDGQKGAWWGYATYTVECFYNISGTVYEDGDNSGDMEAGEDTFGGITVTLYDADGNVVATTTTNADGSYLFEHVPGGADYTVVSGDPSGDYAANENAGGYSISDLSSDVTDVDFGFVPLYDIALSVSVDGDCAADLVVTFNGEVLMAGTDGSYFVENQLPGVEYTLIATATSEAGSVSESWTGMLTADLSLSWALTVECNGGNNEYDDCDTNQDGIVDAAEAAACEEPGNDDFPLWGQDISHVVLVFSSESAPNGDPIDDGYYLIKIDEYQDNDPDDLDSDIDAYLAALVAEGLLSADYDLLASSIKGGRQITSYYNYGSYNANGTASDDAPAGFPLTYNGTSDNEGNQNLIDVVIDRAVLLN